MQSSLALMTGLLGIAAFVTTDHNGTWIVGAMLILVNWPYTLAVIRPTNQKLMATPVESAGSDTRQLIKTWGGLHAVRAVLGAAATIAYLIALARS